MNRHDFIGNIKRVVKKVLNPSPPGEVYIGVDWGAHQDATSVCILTRLPGNEMTVNHRHLAENAIQEQINTISNLIAEYRPKSVVTDIGFGQVQTQMLQDRHGELVKSCYYSNQGPNRVQYDTRTLMLRVDRDQFMRESRMLAGDLNANDSNSLNYAYIAWSTYNTRSRNENTIRPF